MYKTKNLKKKSTVKLHYNSGINFFFLHGHTMHCSLPVIYLPHDGKEKSNYPSCLCLWNSSFTIISTVSSTFKSFDFCLPPSQLSSMNLLLQICTNFKNNFTTDNRMVSIVVHRENTEVLTHLQPWKELVILLGKSTVTSLHLTS
jgi:hypothetical protein